jgi:mRNA-degrading endonuclease YafQ of YafQ-DinJ toxin-antitoxin module
MYTLRLLDSFKFSYNAIVKKDHEKEKRTKKALNILRQDPFYPSLNSHKVNTRIFGEKWNSWVSGDIRIVWDFDPNEKMKIIIFALITHTGTHREYK